MDKEFRAYIDLVLRITVFLNHVPCPIVKYYLENPGYEAIIKKMVVEGCPTYSLIFGSEIGNYNGYPNAVRLSNGICLYNNLSRKALREKINTIAQQVGVEYEILKWG